MSTHPYDHHPTLSINVDSHTIRCSCGWESISGPNTEEAFLLYGNHRAQKAIPEDSVMIKQEALNRMGERVANALLRSEVTQDMPVGACRVLIDQVTLAAFDFGAK